MSKVTLCKCDACKNIVNHTTKYMQVVTCTTYVIIVTKILVS